MTDETTPTVADVCELGDGAHAKIERTHRGVPYLTSKNLGQGTLKLDQLDCISTVDFEKHFPSSSKSIKRLQPGDVLTGIIGTFDNLYVYRDSDLFGISSAIAVIRPDHAKVSSDFLYYYLSSPKLQALKEAMASGSVQGYTNLSVLGSLPVRLPPLAEQRTISEVLGALDAKIAANTKLAQTIEQLGASQIGALGVDSEPTDRAIPLDKLIDFNPRYALQSDAVTRIDMQALPTTRPLIENWAEGPRKGGAKFKNGDTLVARITPCLENRKTGFVDFLKDDEVGIGSTEFMVMRSLPGIHLGVSYFLAISKRFRDFAIKHMAGTSGRQRVAAADIARFEINPIDTNSLVEFGQWADASLKHLGALRDENRTLAMTRESLLPHLMNGALRVKDVEEMGVASV